MSRIGEAIVESEWHDSALTHHSTMYEITGWGERMVGEYFGVVHAISNSQPKDGQHDRIGALTGVIHGRRGRSAEPMERRNGQVKVDIG